MIVMCTQYTQVPSVIQTLIDIIILQHCISVGITQLQKQQMSLARMMP